MKILEAKEQATERHSKVFRFNTPETLAAFSIDETEKAGEADSPRLETIIPFPGVELVGVTVNLPFSKFPKQKLQLNPDGLREIHTGMFSLDCSPAEPLDTEGLNSYELHLWADGEMYVAFIADTGGGRPATRTAKSNQASRSSGSTWTKAGAKSRKNPAANCADSE